MQFDVDGDGIVRPGELTDHAKKQLMVTGQEPTKARIMQVWSVWTSREKNLNIEFPC